MPASSPARRLAKSDLARRCHVCDGAGCLLLPGYGGHPSKNPSRPPCSAGDTLAGLSAYVSTANVVQSCWCNQVTGGASSSSGDSPPVALSVESGTSPDALLGAVPSPASDGAGGEAD